MNRQHTTDVNTPDNYDVIYFGERTNQLLAIPFLIDLLQTICREGKVLDVGCGLGRYFPYYNKCEITGVDFTQKVLDKARADHIELNPTVDNIDIVKDGLKKYPDNTFDYVFCGEVIEHMEHPDRLINEIRRVLKVGGIAIVTTPFENRIVCEEHIWEFDFYDLKELFKDFKHKSIARYHNVYSADWEHFVILATK